MGKIGSGLALACVMGLVYYPRVEELIINEGFLHRPYRQVDFREVFEPDINSRVIRFEVQLKCVGQLFYLAVLSQ